MPQQTLNPVHPSVMQQKRKLQKKQIIIAAVVLLLIVGFILGALNQNNDKGEIVPVTTTTVVRGDITQAVAATGRVIPNFEVEIKGKASGKIVHLPHEVSDYVQQGQLLVELDPIDEVRQVQQTRASLNAIQERVDQSRINLQVAHREIQTEIDKAKANLQAAEAKAQEALAKSSRLKQLRDGDFISQEEYEAGITVAVQAKTDVQNAQTRFNELKTQQLALNARKQDIEIAKSEAGASRVELMQAEQRLSETRIYAPISGHITSKTGQVGQIVASGISNVGGGTSILTLADLSRIFVLASVDESDIGLVQNGQSVRITADAFPGEIFQGRVVQVASKGINESDVVTFEVKIEVTSPNKSKLKPEMTANTEIIISEKHNTLLLPSEAVSIQKGHHIVTVMAQEGKTQQRQVHIGIHNGTQIEILRGLKPGDKVLLNKAEVQSEWRGQGQNSDSQSAQRRAGRMMMRGSRH